jgi:DNA-binding NarL/FixJ family response regulator
LELHAVLLLSSDLETIQHLRSLAPRSWGAVAPEGEAPALRAAAQAVAQGFIVLPPELKLLEPLRRTDTLTAPDGEALTTRELEVLHALVEALPNKRIATELHIAESTVKYHLEGIYAKLGVRSRSQAVRAALKRGLVML